MDRLTFDDDEIELVQMALAHLRHGALGHADGTGNYTPVYGAAWRCCKHVAGKCQVVIERIELWQQDERERKEIDNG